MRDVPLKTARLLNSYRKRLYLPNLMNFPCINSSCLFLFQFINFTRSLRQSSISCLLSCPAESNCRKNHWVIPLWKAIWQLLPISYFFYWFHPTSSNLHAIWVSKASFDMFQSFIISIHIEYSHLGKYYPQSYTWWHKSFLKGVHLSSLINFYLDRLHLK